jgi:hypothetical protein
MITLQEILESEYAAYRTMPNGRICGIRRLMYHWTMHVDINEFGYDDKYCFATLALAKTALDQWDGTGDPIGWHRHLNSGRRRDLATGAEWVAY